MKLFGLVDILINNNYACERDYNDELEDFIYFMNELKMLKEKNICITQDELTNIEDEEIPTWCEYLEEKPIAKDISIGAIDIDSDSYVMFVCTKFILDELKSIAEKVNHRIDRAAKM
ncbi:MAG: hypothetical protein J6J36_09060 [Clostridia bacterium]|nr:hypothetical protein [Clostridia bacterium]